ncbi:MAG TPA: DMT family transporter [Acidimicrobiia bacterium]|nr:DMT family transporter [Acidimicrobiia bacterium]
MDAQAWLATLLAVATAAFYALSNVLEMLEAEQVDESHSLHAGLLTRLMKRPRWWLGMASDIAGYVCQAAALGLATVVFVEPIMATGILMALFIGAAFLHRRVERSDWVAAAVLAGGLALFLYEVSPEGGADFGVGRRWLLAGPLAAAAILACVTFGRSATGARRAAYLGVAAGITYGVAAVLTKAFVNELGNGVFAWWNHWEAYALAVVSIAGVLFAQSALQTGALGAAVGAMEAVGPMLGALMGCWLLDEQITANTPGQVFAIVVAIGGMAWGIVTLAQAEERMVVGFEAIRDG